jgi:hypothetical protein
MVPASIANVTRRERKLSRIFTRILHKDGAHIQSSEASHLPKKKRSFGPVRPLESSGAVSEEVSLRRRAIRKSKDRLSFFCEYSKACTKSARHRRREEHERAEFARDLTNFH